MRALVLGASGFVGKSICEQLNQTNFEVYALKHRSPFQLSFQPREVKGNLDAITTEFIDQNNIDYVFHCARPTLPRFRKWGRKLAARSARKLNEKLLSQLSSSRKKPLLIFASGSLMYGVSEKPHKEKLAINPISFAKDYAEGEIPFTKAIQSQTYPVLMCRLPWMFGNGSWFKWTYFAPGQKSLPLFGDGENQMELLNVCDAATAMISLATHRVQGVANIPGSQRMTQKQWLALVSNISDTPTTTAETHYNGKVDKATREAFLSTILLETKHKDFLSHLNKDIEPDLRDYIQGFSNA